MITTSTRKTPQSIKILQCNLQKSSSKTASILNHPDSKLFTILLLQEQYYSQYTKSSPTHTSWTLLEPTEKTPTHRPRSAIYLNNRLLPSSTFEPIPIPIHDITAVAVTTANESKPTAIITVKTVTLGGFHFKLIFDVRKLKNHIYASFSSYRCNPSIIKSSFYRYASSLVALESTSRSSKFTVGIESGHDCAPYGRVSSPSAKN